MKATTQSSDASHNIDAIALLTADHKKIKKMFKDFENMQDSDDDSELKAELVDQICQELTVHTTIEEEIFYPASRAAIEDTDLMDEADIEHAGAKDLIAQLQGMQPGDDHYDAIVTVLGEQVEHHIKEEENEMFPQVKKAKIDIAQLGEKMQERREALEINLPPMIQEKNKKSSTQSQTRT